jgi:type VI protein secretion system component Hcp
MPIYLNSSGAQWDSNNSASHDGWIEIDSFSFGAGRQITTSGGGSSDREGSTPSVGEIVVKKTTDQASPSLFQGAISMSGIGSGSGSGTGGSGGSGSSHGPIVIKKQIGGASPNLFQESWNSEIPSFAFGEGRSMSTSSGGSSGSRERSSPSVGQIVITRVRDAATPQLFRNVAVNLTFVFANAGSGGSPTRRHILKLKNAVLTDLKPHFCQRKGESTTSEKLTFAFSKYSLDGFENGSLQSISSATAG